MPVRFFALLPSGEFLQTTHGLRLFAPFRALGRLCLALGFVAVFGVGQIHLLKLALHLLFTAAAALLAIAEAGGPKNVWQVENF